MMQNIMKDAAPILTMVGAAAVLYVGVQFIIKYAPRLPFLNGGGGQVPIPLPLPSPQPGTDNPPAPVTNGDEYTDISDEYLFGDLLRV